MLICHATGFHARCYEPMVEEFSRHYTVWGADVRGHGQSQIAPGTEFVWTDFADDVIAAVEHLGGGPLPVFGHSMGGAALLLAETKRPGSFTVAFTYEPIIFPGELGPRNSMMSTAAAKRRSEFPSRAEALARYASRPPLNRLRADALASYVDGGFLDTDEGTVRLACRPEHEAMTFDGARIPLADVEGVQLPVVVARGTSSHSPSAADFAAGTAAGLGLGELVEYQGLGHLGPMENPTRIALDVLAAFDGRVAAADVDEARRASCRVLHHFGEQGADRGVYRLGCVR